MWRGIYTLLSVYSIEYCSLVYLQSIENVLYMPLGAHDNEVEQHCPVVLVVYWQYTDNCKRLSTRDRYLLILTSAV